MSGLVTVALVLTGIAARTAMQHYLMGRVDSQLRVAAIQIAQQTAHDGPNSGDFAPHQGDSDADSADASCGGGKTGSAAAAGSPPTSSAPGSGGQDGDQQHPLLPSQYFVQVDDATGAPTGQASYLLTDCDDAPAIPRLTSAQVGARAGDPFSVPARSGDSNWRVVVSLLPGRTETVAVATPLSDVKSTLRTLSLFELTIGAGVLLVLAGLAYVAVRRSLRPLIDVEETAEAIAGGDLTQRVSEGDPRTEVGRLSRALNGMLSQIESAFRSREKSEKEARESEGRMRRFITDAGHELRTPLTSIRGFAELYRIGGVEERAEIDRMMRRIEDESARMSLLVDDLLLLARLDQHRPLERTLVDMTSIANDAVLDARAVAPTRTVLADIAPDLAPAVVVGDEARLRQVVGNLVSNALNHTPGTASITVRLDVRPDDPQPCVVLEVSDTGPGLAPADAERIFERFYRAEQSRSRTNGGGAGLGLSIVDSLTAAHGGSVELETAEGAGATFRVRLPLAVMTEADDEEPAALVSRRVSGRVSGPESQEGLGG
jgi:two-component system OmpR family sensor kinase